MSTGLRGWGSYNIKATILFQQKHSGDVSKASLTYQETSALGMSFDKCKHMSTYVVCFCVVDVLAESVPFGERSGTVLNQIEGLQGTER